MNLKEQTDYHTLRPIHLEAGQFEDSMIAMQWEEEKYGRVKYWDEVPFLKGMFFSHREMYDFNIGLS